MRIRRVFFACAIVGLLQIPAEVLAQYNMGSNSESGMQSVDLNGAAGHVRQPRDGRNGHGIGPGASNSGNQFGSQNNDVSNAHSSAAIVSRAISSAKMHRTCNMKSFHSGRD